MVESIPINFHTDTIIEIVYDNQQDHISPMYRSPKQDLPSEPWKEMPIFQPDIQIEIPLYQELPLPA